MKKARKKLKAEIVFRLIKKMSQSDKRYFKINTQTYKTDKDFLKLFDYLNTREDFDMADLKKFFEKENVTNTSRCIQHLHHKIINTLSQAAKKLLSNKGEIYHKNIEQHLSICSVYLYADLPEYALEELHKAEEIATQLGDYDYLIRIYRLNENILNMTHLNHDKYEKWREEISDKLESALKQLLINNDIFKNTRKIVFGATPNTPEYLTAFHKIQKYATNIEDLPHACQQAVLRATIHHHYLRKEHMEMIVLLERMIESWASIPCERWNLNAYIEQWNNLLVISSNPNIPRSKFDECFRRYIKLPERHPFIFDGPTQTFQRSYFIIKYSVQIICMLVYEEYHKIYDTEQELLTGLRNFQYLPTLRKMMQLIFLRMSLIHLILQNYERADYWLNQYEELPDSEDSVWNSTYETLRVMMHYELENYTYLKSKIKNLKRKWKKEKVESPNVLVLLSLIQKTLLKSNQNKTPEIWKTGLEEIYQAEKTRNIHFIKLSKWVETKVKSA